MIDFLQLKAVIWDMDGVLVDSEPIHLKTWKAVFKKFNQPFHPERMKHAFGMTSERVVEVMVDSPLPEEKIKEITQEKARLFQRAIAEEAAIFPGVAGWLASFKNNNIRQAVASSARAENIRIVLEKLEIKDYFDVVVDGYGVPSKPAPAIFLKAADLLDVNPLKCLVIEDSTAGVQAAKAAGMQCVAVATTSSVSQLGSADVVVENLGQLMTEDLRALFPI